MLSKNKNKFLRHKNKQFIGLIISSLFLIACSKNSDGDQLCLKYIAVQIEEGDYWSIMDCNGKIIVKEEYSPDNDISKISQEGVYWVKSGIDGKFRYFVFVKKGNHLAELHLFRVVLACEKRQANGDERDGQNGIQNDRLCISFHVFISSEDSFIIFQK